MKKIIAITGGYASGKTEILRVAKQIGFATFSCDEISKELQQETFYKNLLKEKFGEEIFENGVLNTKKLASIVFEDLILLNALNEIAHAQIEKRLFEKIEATKSDIIFVEVPLLFECNMQSKFWKNILVVADFDARIERGQKRDNNTKQDVLQRINCQMSDKEKIALSDYVVYNNGDLNKLKTQFEEVLGKIFE